MGVERRRLVVLTTDLGSILHSTIGKGCKGWSEGAWGVLIGALTGLVVDSVCMYVCMYATLRSGGQGRSQR